MSYHYPIYCFINRNEGGASPQFGARKGFEQKIHVGTSRKNSHVFGALDVERYELDDGAVRFTMFLDGERVKSGVLRGKEFTQDYAAEISPQVAS